MKTNVFKINLFELLVVSLLFVACSEDNNTIEETEANYSVENTALATKTDNIVEGSLSVMENGYVEVNGENRGNTVESLFPDCTIITLEANGNGGTITLDFGDECQLFNGAIVSGKIIMEYGPFENGSRTITYTFENYFYNGNGVEGEGEIVRKLENENGNPESTVNESITVSFSETDVSATRIGTRVVEWVEGVGSGNWDDNIYHITGNWNTTLSNGFERSGEVTEQLVKKMSCLWLVSGVLAIEQQNITATIDFGEGECDAQATIIINGQEFPVGA